MDKRSPQMPPLPPGAFSDRYGHQSLQPGLDPNIPPLPPHYSSDAPPTYPSHPPPPYSSFPSPHPIPEQLPCPSHGTSPSPPFTSACTCQHPPVRCCCSYSAPHCPPSDHIISEKQIRKIQKVEEKKAHKAEKLLYKEMKKADKEQKKMEKELRKVEKKLVKHGVPYLGQGCSCCSGPHMDGCGSKKH